MNIYLKFKTSALSFLINFFNADNYHNASKFFTIYKIWNNIKLDDIEGDYIEFGIFKGKSLLHSIKTYKQFFTSKDNIMFYGLDSFDGFPSDNHNFYNSNKNYHVYDTFSGLPSFTYEYNIDSLFHLKKNDFSCSLSKYAEILEKFNIHNFPIIHQSSTINNFSSDFISFVIKDPVPKFKFLPSVGARARLYRFLV